MGAFTGLLHGLAGTVTGLLNGLAAAAGTVADAIWIALERVLVRLSAGLTGLVWGVAVVVWIVGAAVALNLAGVDDVYGVLDGVLGDDGRPSVEAPTDVSPEAVTDSRGHFSAERLRQVTGLEPTEFIHLVVQANGGRTEQATLTTCLPWSKATVSRYLDELEAAGVVERVSVGNRNVVCTPDERPEGADAEP